MRYYIKRGERAAIMLFKRGNDADYERVDAIDAHNLGIAEQVYNAIMSANADYAYIRDGQRLIAYTRSLHGNFIQATYFVNMNGDTLPTMHTDVTSIKALEQTFVPGKYITIAA